MPQPAMALQTQAAAALGLETRHILAAQWLDKDASWLGLLLDSALTVEQLSPAPLPPPNLWQKVAVAAVLYTQAAPILIARSNREARAFGPRFAAATACAADAPELAVRTFGADGVEDTAINAPLNARLHQWLHDDGHLR